MFMCILASICSFIHLSIHSSKRSTIKYDWKYFCITLPIAPPQLQFFSLILNSFSIVLLECVFLFLLRWLIFCVNWPGHEVHRYLAKHFFLVVPEEVFLEKLAFESKCLFQCEWVSSNLLKVCKELKSKGRENSFSAWLLELGHQYSPALGMGRRMVLYHWFSWIFNFQTADYEISASVTVWGQFL